MGTTSVKRRKISDSSTKITDSSTGLEDSSNDVLRKFFESRFRPLDDTHIHKNCDQASAVSEDDDDDESAEENFEGFSDHGEDDDDEDKEEEQVTVVEHVDVRNENVLLDKQTRKAILSAKVPASADTLNSTTKKSNKAKDEDEDVDDETANLQNDLALQRLLKESHLLDSTSSDLNPTGKNRHKALDLRLQALGAKKSIFERNKMPKSHRQGIEAKAAKTEATRRREARENGIILEKPVFKQQKNGSSSSAKRRDRGVGAPAVGKFAGGTLRLSKRDLASIQGPSRKGGRGSKRGRR